MDYENCLILYRAWVHSNDLGPFILSLNYVEDISTLYLQHIAHEHMEIDSIVNFLFQQNLRKSNGRKVEITKSVQLV